MAYGFNLLYSSSSSYSYIAVVWAALESDTGIRVLREVIIVKTPSCHIYMTQKAGPEALGAVCIIVLSLWAVM